MKTSHPRIRVINHGRFNWRTEARDDLGEWAITGPPYPTRAEALVNVDRVAEVFFGTPAPRPAPAPDSALGRLDQAEKRIIELGGRAARDGRLASVLSALRDELTAAAWLAGESSDGLCHRQQISGDCTMPAGHPGYCDWEGR